MAAATKSRITFFLSKENNIMETECNMLVQTYVAIKDEVQVMIQTGWHFLGRLLVAGHLSKDILAFVQSLFVPTKVKLFKISETKDKLSKNLRCIDLHTTSIN